MEDEVLLLYFLSGTPSPAWYDQILGCAKVFLASAAERLLPADAGSSGMRRLFEANQLNTVAKLFLRFPVPRTSYGMLRVHASVQPAASRHSSEHWSQSGLPLDQPGGLPV